MFINTIRKIKEKKYIKKLKAINEKPFCFQYEFFKELQTEAKADYMKKKISPTFYLNYFIVDDFREMIKTL